MPHKLTRSSRVVPDLRNAIPLRRLCVCLSVCLSVCLPVCLSIFIMDQPKTVLIYPPLILCSTSFCCQSGQIDPTKKGMVIGSGGKTINAIREACAVSIDIDEEGIVEIMAKSKEGMKMACEYISLLVEDLPKGKIFRYVSDLI